MSSNRTLKAREALRNALSELVLEKPYEEITVQDVTQRADVSRSSFYVHFRDKDDLLLSGFENIGVDSYEDLFDNTDSASPYPDFAIVLFRGSELNKDIARELLSIGANTPAYFHMRNMIVIKMREWLEQQRPQLEPIKREATVHFLSNALQGMLTWWLTNDCPFPAEEASLHFNQLAIQGLDGLLKPEPVGTEQP